MTRDQLTGKRSAIYLQDDHSSEQADLRHLASIGCEPHLAAKINFCMQSPPLRALSLLFGRGARAQYDFLGMIEFGKDTFTFSTQDKTQTRTYPMPTEGDMTEDGFVMNTEEGTQARWIIY